MNDEIADARQTDELLDEEQAQQIAVRKVIYALAGDDVDPAEVGHVEAAVRAVNRVERLENENAELREEMRRLRDRVRDMQDAADLYQSVSHKSAATRDRQAAKVLKIAVKRGSSPTASTRQEFDAGRIQDVLNDEIHRTNTYRVMERAAELVDDEDICWVKKEPRSSSKNTRLIVETDTDNLPKTVAGVRIHEGVLSG